MAVMNPPLSSTKDPLLSAGGNFFSFIFRAMGTDCQVDFECSPYARAAEFRGQVLAWLREFEDKFSRFIPSSLISRINLAAGRDWVELDEEAESLFALCDRFHWVTRGLFDPTTLPLLDLWDYHRAQPRVPDADAIRAALTRVGWSKVQRKGGLICLPEAGMGLDVGGIGKEYAVDRVLEMGLARGIQNIHVNFGHDLRVHGGPPEGGPWRVGLEDPNDPGRCWGGVAVHDRAVTTSGNYLRYFEADGRRYGHILDPRTGYPVNNGCSSVTVIAPTCTEAGILSTTAVILGPEAGLDLLNGSYLAEGCLWASKERLHTGRFDSYVIS